MEAEWFSFLDLLALFSLEQGHFFEIQFHLFGTDIQEVAPPDKILNINKSP